MEWVLNMAGKGYSDYVLAVIKLMQDEAFMIEMEFMDQVACENDVELVDEQVVAKAVVDLARCTVACELQRMRFHPCGPP